MSAAADAHGYVLAVRLLQSQAVLDEVEQAAAAYFIGQRRAAALEWSGAAAPPPSTAGAQGRDNITKDFPHKE